MLTNVNVKENSNYGLNYVSAIDSVIEKHLYPSSTVLKQADYDDDKDDVNDAKERKNEKNENKILLQNYFIKHKLLSCIRYYMNLIQYKLIAKKFLMKLYKYKICYFLKISILFILLSLFK